MSEPFRETFGSVERLPSADSPNMLANGLERLKNMLKSEFPAAEGISFEFKDRLKAHIDIRDRDELRLTEVRLAALSGGMMFSDISHGAAPQSPFLHRVTAIVRQ